MADIVRINMVSRLHISKIAYDLFFKSGILHFNRFAVEKSQNLI
jgi:hypothetical protein